MPRTPQSWKPWLFATIVAAIGFAAEHQVERLQRESLRQHERTAAIGALSQVRARLESAINGNLLMAQGLSAVIAAQPDIDQAGFARIARGFVGDDRPIRNIAGAPGLVISLMYPVAGNEAAIGLDYRRHPTQRDAALAAVERGEPVTAGPFELVQGGIGLVSREPVFVAAEQPGGKPTLWGLVSAVIDMERLFAAAKLTETLQANGLDLAIRGRDGLGERGEVFYGDAALFDEAAITSTVQLPGGSWQLAARPRPGWHMGQHAHEFSVTRILGLLITLVVAVLTFLITRNTQALRRSESELRRSQSLFSGFMRHLPAGTFVRDATDRSLVFENRWLREHLVDDKHGCGIDEMLDTDELRKGPRLLQRQLHQVADGPVYCDTLSFLLDDGRGRPLIGGVVMDVTKRVLAEQDLAASRVRLRALFDTIPDLVWLKDPDGIYLACNRRFESLFGAPEKDIVGRRDHDFVDAQLADFFRRHDLAAIAAGGPLVNEETVTFASDGHEELLETIKTPVVADDGTLIGVLGIARDISARRAAENALRTANQRLENAERLAHIGNWQYRVADGRVTWSNETYRIFGLAPGEPVDYALILSRVHPADREAHDAYLQQMLSSTPGAAIPQLRYRLVRDDGSEAIVVVTSRVEYTAEGTAALCFGTLQDVTESERLKLDLEERLAELTRWQGVMLGREDRIAELKREVNELLQASGKAARYASQGENA